MKFDDGRPFTYRQAVAAGISRRTLQSPGYRLLLRNAYIGADATVDGHVEAQATLLVAQPRAFVSHHTAARAWGGVVPHSPVAHVSIPPGRGRSQRRDVVVHTSSRTPTRYRGLAVTTPVDTFLDLAAQLTLVDLVILGDSLVRPGRPGHLHLPGRHDRAAEAHLPTAGPPGGSTQPGVAVSLSRSVVSDVAH